MKKCDGSDFVRFGPPTSEGLPFVRHRPDHSLEAGVAVPVKEGQPLHSGAMMVSHREADIYDVTDVYEGSSSTHSGPAMVNTRNYQDGWDRIFGKKKTDAALN